MANILVLGSVNMDLVVRTTHIPLPGETVLGSDFRTFPGGKGANQAVAAARQGAKVAFIGRVGRDDFGQQLMEQLKSEGIDIQNISIDDTAPSGIASITLDENGENCIVVAPGANYTLTTTHIDRAEKVFKSADILLTQLEIPLEVIISAAKKASEQGLKIVLNPAPARILPEELLRLVDVLIPNENECEILSGLPVNTLADIEEASLFLLNQGVGCVIVTMGSRGAFFKQSDQCGIHVPAFNVDVVDTTAAGDSFVGSLVVALAEGESISRAVRRGCAAGALATTRLGAQPSIPTKDEVYQFLESVG